MQKKRIAVFASGSGTNAERIIRYFRQSDIAEVAVLVCNRPGAGAIDRARSLGVPVELLDRTQINTPEVMNPMFDRYAVDLVVLAGFLLMVPGFILSRFDNRVLNIHPSLLPKFGGKGMYGLNVHKAVIEAGETVSGATVHYSVKEIDAGAIILQRSLDVLPEHARKPAKAHTRTDRTPAVGGGCRNAVRARGRTCRRGRRRITIGSE